MVKMLNLTTKIYTISELNSMIKTILQQEELLQYIQVQGEISNYKRYASGHAYFTIKDANSNLKAVIFNSRVQKLNFQPVNGMQIVALGSITVYERDGVYQLMVERILPSGQGDMQLLFERLKAKFEQEGLFATQHKKSLPLVPKAIGVITSPDGAAIRDIIKVSKLRYPGVKIYLAPVRVQGLQSEAEINQAIDLLNRIPNIEVIILGRGGGSKEDLWVFNSESVVRKVYASRIPIISAVGHEIDTTLVDYVADVRAATPSQAAELAVPVYQVLQEKVARLQKLAVQLQKQRLLRLRFRVEACQNNYIFRNPQLVFRKYRQNLVQKQEQLIKLSSELLNLKQRKYRELLIKLEASSPLKVLARGFACITSEGEIVRRIAQIKPQAQLELTLIDGVILAEVLELRKNGR
ncbi:exodeoxyribonuclease VII large subunit [Succinispira mobilis]|uniref:exodeoxyribonuclease VII large subunit n=1 Tax=Succinispira mobilis TaxID=78120 RepID=UPI00048BC583|nr:exodeoxyribonuclease VII large subunit [Succinispira mobilis]